MIYKNYKFCSICELKLSTTKYNSKQSACKACLAFKKKQVVEDNYNKLYELLKDKSCMDCGLDDMRVLEFDHLSNKKFNVADMLSKAYKWEDIELEINKCDIICSNCHKIRTMKKYNFNRAKWF